MAPRFEICYNASLHVNATVCLDSHLFDCRDSFISNARRDKIVNSYSDLFF